MKLRWLAAASALALLGAFAAPGIAQAGTASPGAGRARPALPAPDCRTRQLRLHTGPRVSEKTRQETVIFVVRNVSSRRCGLDGYPVVSLLTARGLRGQVLPFRYRDRGDQMLTSARPHLVLLAPGGRAYVGINKNACVGRGRRTARYLAMFPLGQLQLKLRTYPVLGYCGRNDPGHVVDVSPFEKTARAVLATH